jgi:hypothetical protein
MTERESNWLKRFGVNPDSLDRETQELVEKLGKQGVQDLVKSARAGKLHRGVRITENERVGLIQQIRRLQDGGGGEWAPGERPIGGDTPRGWINDELEYLEGD